MNWGACVVSVVKMYFTHKERLKMIQRGIHPDHQTEEEPVEENYTERV